MYPPQMGYANPVSQMMPMQPPMQPPMNPQMYPKMQGHARGHYPGQMPPNSSSRMMGGESDTLRGLNNPNMYNTNQYPMPQNNQRRKVPLPSGGEDPIKDLTGAATVTIKQRTSCLEVLTGCFCECDNTYDVIIEDSSKAQKHLFEMEEINNCCWKNLACPQCRSFEMEVRQVIEKDGTKTVSPLVTLKRPCKVGFCGCCTPIIESFKGTKYMGKAVEPCKICCGYDLDTFDENGTEKYRITLGCCQCGFCCCQCCNVRGDIYQKGTEAIVGVVTKNCCSSGTYHLNFPNNANFNEKLNLIAAVVLMDYRKFE